ncbi:MAG: hypothetical protein AAF959_16190 [Cyanobacteria bacterium P01_D01_bin.56]
MDALGWELPQQLAAITVQNFNRQRNPFHLGIKKARHGVAGFGGNAEILRVRLERDAVSATYRVFIADFIKGLKGGGEIITFCMINIFHRRYSNVCSSVAVASKF